MYACIVTDPLLPGVMVAWRFSKRFRCWAVSGRMGLGDPPLGASPGLGCLVGGKPQFSDLCGHEAGGQLQLLFQRWRTLTRAGRWLTLRFNRARFAAAEDGGNAVLLPLQGALQLAVGGAPRPPALADRRRRPSG